MWPLAAGRSAKSSKAREAGRTLVDLSKEEAAWLAVYCYPRTGRSDQEPIIGTAAWNAMPGARGCTPQSCRFLC